MSYSFQTIDDSADPNLNSLGGINNAGTIAGSFGDNMTFPLRGYTVTPPYAQSNFINENFPNSVQTSVKAINNLGLTAGFWADTLPDRKSFGFVENAGTFTNVVGPDAIGTTVPFTQLLGINDQGVAVGDDADSNGTLHSFAYDTGSKTFTPIAGPTGALGVFVSSINNEGTIAGSFINASDMREGFVETSPGNFTLLNGPQGTLDKGFEINGLNNENQVVGDYFGPDGNDHGFVYDLVSNRWTTIDQGNNTVTSVNGINDLGQIVGIELDANRMHGFLASIPSTIATIHNPTAGSTIEVPAGYDGVTLGGTQSVTLQDLLAGHALLQANAGNDLVISAVAGDTLTGGVGHDTLNGAAGTATTFRDGGGNASMIGGNGNDQFIGTTGNDTITTGARSNTIMPGSGADQINAHGSLDVIFPGGSDTVFAFGKVLAAVGSGQLVFVNGAEQATVIGGNSGAALIAGGPGGGLFAGGNGGLNIIFGGSGAATIFGSSGSDLLFAGGSNADVLIAGSGNETLTGLGSTGNNVFYAGVGNDLLGGGAGNETFFGSHGNSCVIGGTGADLYAFVNNVFAGGSEIIFGFNAGKGDRVTLQNYGANAVQNALATQQNLAGSTVLKLSDNTQITFVAVASLNANAFT